MSDKTVLIRTYPAGSGPLDAAALASINAAGREPRWGKVDEPTDGEEVTYLDEVKVGQTDGLQGETSTVLMDALEAGGTLALSPTQIENARKAATFAVGLAGERALSMWTILCDSLADLATVTAEVDAAETVDEASAVKLPTSVAPTPSK